MPIFFNVRITRQAISPRLAIKTFLNIAPRPYFGRAVPAPWGALRVVPQASV
jgi:hypothetical protein